MHSVYGGVQFGLDRMSPQLISGLGHGAEAPFAAHALPDQPIGGYIPLPRARAAPKGVDLNLDKFGLTAPERLGLGGPVHAAQGDKFWSSLSGGGKSAAGDASLDLFKQVYTPQLCDRRSEGDLFAGPNCNASYLQKLRGLVEEEAQAKQQRKDHFLSAGFTVGNAGPLFPLSWTSSIEIACRRAPRQLHAHSDHEIKAEELKPTEITFDQHTEDGVRFRIYKHGHLDVRTIQEQGGKEVIGAIFMAGSLPRSPARWGQAQDQDKVTKVTEYVEIVDNLLMGENIMGNTYFHSYVVIETARGDAIVTEKLADGSAVWDENPGNIEERNSLAKCIRSSDCGQGRGASATVGDIKAYMRAEGPDASHSACKKYTQAVYSIILGLRSIDSGFGDKSGWNKAEKKAQALKKKKAAERREAAAAAKAARSRG
mmetsp:Transcript_69944/g.197345  ORF Transcript_69944/g.197345 Transcript_69944/m.197345 type:complete len:427 (+) Transcript_69944:2-1282(+)